MTDSTTITMGEYIDNLTQETSISDATKVISKKGTDDPRYTENEDLGGASGVPAPQAYLDGAPYVADDIVMVRANRAFTLSKIRIGLKKAATGSSVTVDIHYHATDPTSATTIFTTGPGTNRPVLTTSSYTDDSGTPDVTSIADGGFFIICVDGADSNNIAYGLSVEFIEA